jgi:hypothetical protein
MIRIFAVLNGVILNDDQNWSPTYTTIRFLPGCRGQILQ